MPSAPLQYAVAGAGALAFVREGYLLVRARGRAKLASGELRDEATGLRAVSLVPVEFPPLLDTANDLDAMLVVAVVNAGAREPSAVFAQFTHGLRRNELAYRLDYDRCAVVMVVHERAEAIRAVARLGRGLHDPDGVRVGVAAFPDDGVDFLELSEVAGRRLAPLDRFADVAGALAMLADSD